MDQRNGTECGTVCRRELQNVLRNARLVQQQCHGVRDQRCGRRRLGDNRIACH